MALNLGFHALGSFLSRRRPSFVTADFIKTGPHSQSDCKKAALKCTRVNALRIFAMTYTMKMSLFLYLVIMTVIAAGRSGFLFPPH